MTDRASLADLLAEYDRARGYTDALWRDLSADEVRWRPHPDSSAIGWHLGHQAAVAHFMVRNLTAAEPSLDPHLDALMDSATAERDRGELPDVGDLARYRDTVAERVAHHVTTIDRGEVGAPAQLRAIAETMLVALTDHEYQHDQWIGEVRSGPLGHPLPPRPSSGLLTEVDSYLMIGTSARAAR